MTKKEKLLKEKLPIKCGQIFQLSKLFSIELRQNVKEQLSLNEHPQILKYVGWLISFRLNDIHTK